MYEENAAFGRIFGTVFHTRWNEPVSGIPQFSRQLAFFGQKG
ncbi:MAG: hypothetical protein OEW62_04375 [Candidatus Bathyarchaeota archaeon]|nr:hypothetical protein [Candidatus Bathyarchaeota archaeon]